MRRFKATSTRAAAAIVILFSASLTYADSAQIYDVRDLLLCIPNYTGGDQASKTPSRDAIANNVLAAVKNTLPATTPTDAVTLDQGRLSVKADAAALASVAELLKSMRAAVSQQVRVSASVVTFSPAAFSKLDKPLSTRLLTPTQPIAAPATLSKDEVATVTTIGESITAPRLTLFARQTAYVLTETQTAYVSDFTKSIGSDGSVGFAPVVSIASPGMKFEAVGTAASNGIAMKLHCDAPRLLGFNTVQKAGEKIQQPETVSYHWDGLYVIPDGVTLAIPCFDSTRSIAGANAHAEDRVFLLVNAETVKAAQPHRAE